MDSKKIYTKPFLHNIELVAEEVLTVACKTATSKATHGYLPTKPCSRNRSPCNNIGS